MFRTRFCDRVAVKVNCGAGKTKGSFKDECDINKVVDRAKRTGYLPPVPAERQFLDVTSVPSYQEALDLVLRAQTEFYGLPASVRAECGNNPAVFLERVKDPEWAIKHKLATARDLPPSQPSSGSPEPATGAPGAPKGPGLTQPGGDPSGGAKG